MKLQIKRKSMRARAFTLIELAVVNVVLVAGVAVLGPVSSHSRGAARNIESVRNLRTLGAGSASYASDNNDIIFGLNPSVSTAKRQAIDILSRRTGRQIGGGEDIALVRLSSIMPHRRYQHFVLMDYLGAQLPEPILASPFDRNLIEWQTDPVLAQETLVPYASVETYPPGTDRSSNWPADDVRQLWPYGSTYQVVPAAWNPNNSSGHRSSWEPITYTPHLFERSGATSGFGPQRFYKDVAFPSKKVHMFEEFDRFNKRSHGEAIWYAYPEAMCNLLFFDGSVRRLPTRASNPGWNPAEPNTAGWGQFYVPIDTFPIYPDGHSPDEKITPKYRWTREGLGGIDFGGSDVYPLVGRKSRARLDR